MKTAQGVVAPGQAPDEAPTNLSLSSDDLADIRSFLDSPGAAGGIRQVHRAEFLPYLFKLRGQPFSLKDHGPFRVM